METGLHNTSEIGRLKKVLLHRPGAELENLMPEYLERLLFDDIPYLREAQREHDAFADCLRSQGVEVVYLTDLVVHSLTSDEVRRDFIRQFLDESGVQDDRTRGILEDFLGEMPDKEMVSTMMAGIRKGQLRAESRHCSRSFSPSGCGTPRFTRTPSVSASRRIGWSQSRVQEASIFQYRPSFSARRVPFCTPSIGYSCIKNTSRNELEKQ